MGIGRRVLIFLAALFIALLLWTYVHLAGSFEIALDIPISVTSPAGYALAKELPQKITAQVRGPGWRLMLMSFTSKTKFLVDLTNRDASTIVNSRYYITSADLSASASLPQDVKLLKIEPDSIELLFAREVTKRVPVVIRLDAEASSGYTIVGDPMIQPSYVTIEGSNIMLDSLAYFPTKPLRLRNLRESVTMQVELADTLHDVITSRSVSAVRVSINVQATGEREMKDIPLNVDAVPPDRELLLIPSTITLSLRGGVDLLAHLDPKDIRAGVVYDVAAFDTLQSIVPTVTVPKGVEVLTIEPNTVKFIVRKR
jgi:YbbR domain-containing protein